MADDSDILNSPAEWEELWLSVCEIVVERGARCEMRDQCSLYEVLVGELDLAGRLVEE